MQASSYPSTKPFFKSPTYLLWGLSILMTGLFSCMGNVQAETNESALYIDEKGDLTIGTTTFIYQSGNVGIGTLEPKSSLSVAGGLAVGANYAKTNAAAMDDLLVEGKVGIGTTTPRAPLAVMQNVNGLLTGLQFSGQNTPNVTAGGVINAFDADGKTVRYLTLQSNGGNVGIGTTEPKSTLSVAGGLAVGNSYAKSKVAEPNNLLVEGDAGIGVPGKPQDKLDVAGNLRILTDGSNPIRFTSKWSGFSNGKSNQAEISNDTDAFKTLMIVGNPSAGGTIRRVGIWDQLQMNGDLFVHGRLILKVGDQWRHLSSRTGSPWDWSTSTPTAGPSDLRLKSQIESLPTALDKIRRLRGVTYRWNDVALKYFTRDIKTTLSAGPNATEAENQKLWQTERNKRYKELDTTQVGVIAQDVEAVLPEAVTTDKAGYKSVQYQYLIPLLIEALKEQEQTVAAQAKVVARQQTEIERLTVAHQTAQQQFSELGAVKARVARLESVMQHFALTQISGTPVALGTSFQDQGELIATGKKQ